MARINNKASNKTVRSLNHELECLFGTEIVNQSADEVILSLQLSDEQMERIHGTVEYLLDNTRHPLKQQYIVSNMNYQDKLILCAWINDLNIAARHHTYC